MKKKIFIWLTLFLVLGGGLYYAYNVYWRPDDFLKQIYLIPRDAMYIVETENPIDNWKDFSRSKPWQYLKAQPKMEAIGNKAHKLDSLLQANQSTMDLVGKRNVMISAHMTKRNDYDFLFVVDIQKASKLDALKDQMENFLKTTTFQVTSRKFEDYKILELFDPEDRTTLYMAFVDNHIVCSYTSLLVEKSIQEKDEPVIGRDLYFTEMEQKTKDWGLCKIYINYAYINNYISALMGMTDENMADICQSLKYTGFTFEGNDEQLSLKGFTNLNDSTDSYLPALLHSGKNNVTAQSILSYRTAFFLSMGFDDAGKFMDNVEIAMKNDPEAYDAFKKNWDRIEDWLKIDIRKNFLSWMEGEVVFAQNTPGSLGRQNEFVAVIKMNDKDEALKNLNFIEERIRKRTPITFKTIEYEGFGIHYMEMKGFFRLLFGKMFDKLNKPYYTIIDDYAVFSNSTATLLSMIEDYRMGQTLDKDESFNRFIKQFNSKSSIFTYTNAPKFFPLWKEFVSPSTWKDLQANQNFVVCFPQTAFQLTGDGNMFDTRFIAEFAEPTTPAAAPEIIDEEEEEVDFAAREDTLQNLERFYIEKMSGNVYTEFYDDGSVKSKTEMSDGVRHGKYKAFYPNGKLKINGKFKNNKKTGTWRYYDEEEKLTNKEKWKDGVLK